MKIHFPTLLAALAVTGAGAFFAGRISSSGQETREMPENTRTVSRTADFPRSAGASSSSSTHPTDRRESPARRETSPEQRLARIGTILRDGNALDRNRAWLDWVDRLSPSEFQNAVAEFRSLGLTGSRFGEYSLLLSAWAKADPTAALAYATTEIREDSAIGTVLSSWASADPESAIRWAESNHKGEKANPFFSSIISAIGGSDPDRATLLLTSMPRSNERGDAVKAMIPHLLAQGPESARQWIANLEEDTLRNGAALIATGEMAVVDPAGTMNWLLEGQGDATRRRMDDVFNIWAGQDLSAAQAALSTLPAGENRTNALRGIVGQLASTDPEAALSFMSSHPGDLNDQVIENFVWRSLHNAPETAIGQIPSISNQEIRNRMYTRTVNNWLFRDPASARSWLERNPLPKEVQNRIRLVN